MNHLSSPWFCFSSKHFAAPKIPIHIYLFVYFCCSSPRWGILCIFMATYWNLEQVPRQAFQWLLSVYTYMTLTVILFFAEKKSRGFMFSLRVEFQCLSGRWNSVGSLEDSRRTRCVSPAPEVAQKCQEESVLHDFFPHSPVWSQRPGHPHTQHVSYLCKCQDGMLFSRNECFMSHLIVLALFY